MVRTSKHALKFQTKSKDNQLVQAMYDFRACLQVYLDDLCKDLSKVKKWASTRDLPIISNLQHSSWRSIAYKTASEIVRSQARKATTKRYDRYKKIYAWCLKKAKCSWFTSKKFSQLNLKPIEQTKYFCKPDLKNFSVTLDCRLFNVKPGNHFDEFVQISLPYLRNSRYTYKVNIPLKHHRYSRNLEKNGWKRRNSIGLRFKDNKLFLDLFWEKEEAPKKVIHKSVGIDQGYKKLITCSDGKIYDNKGALFQIYQRLSKKVHGSKGSQRLQRTRTDLTNKLTKQFFTDHSDCELIIVEDLVDVKKRKGRKPFYKTKKQRETTRKVSKWSYRTVMAKLEQLCAENGVHLYKIEPAYTSQTCSNCGAVDKASRDAEDYTCLHCGMKMDADLNAAINIHRLGVMYPGAREVSK